MISLLLLDLAIGLRSVLKRGINQKLRDLKGQSAVYEAVQVFTAHVILLGPKKVTSFIVDVINAHNKE